MKDREFVHDARMLIDLSVSRSTLKPQRIRDWLLSRLGKEIVVEDFEMLPIAEGILKALSKIGFRNVAWVTTQDGTAYSHPGRTGDLRDVLGNMGELLRNGASLMELEVVHGGRRALTTVSKTHRQGMHSIEIRFEGRMQHKTLNSFAKHLGDLLPIERLDMSS